MATLLELELKGLPPTVNHLYRTGRNNIRYKTAMGRLYQDYVILSLRNLWSGSEVYTGDIELQIVLTSANRRRWDIDNRVKALQDCLSLAGIIKDDSQVQILHVERVYGAKAGTYLKISSIER